MPVFQADLPTFGFCSFFLRRRENHCCQQNWIFHQVSSVEVNKKGPNMFVGYILTLGGVCGEIGSKERDGKRKLTVIKLTPMFDGSFKVSIANALSSTWVLGISLTRVNWSLIAWKRQFPSPGMLTDLTWSPEFVIFWRSISSWRKRCRMSSIEFLRAPAISRCENGSVDFVCEPVDKRGNYI